MADPNDRPSRRPRPSRPPRGVQSKGPRFSSISKSVALWLLIILLPLFLYRLLVPRKQELVKVRTSEFLEQLEEGNVASVTISERRIEGELERPGVTRVDGPGGRQAEQPYTHFRTSIPYDDAELIREMEAAGVAIDTREPSVNWFAGLLNLLPWIFIIGFWVFFMRQLQGGGSKAFSFGKSKAKLLSADRPKITFEDVAGADEAKVELQEIIEFLKDPKKFQRLGGRIPKGALLLGPPGTGKTLLARAVAGEAAVPFFSMSGSDFVEMFVGVGAARVRDLFEQGKANAPCIIFVDEIDAVGRHRGAGLGGGHDEREQTLNQLLVEMDGFESNEGVILIAATNRPDVLDPALLRPGRFDRQIVVDRPDVKGREGIFRVHTREIPLADGVDLKTLAKGTPGLAGADIENIVNEAALWAARHNKTKVDMDDFEEAKDKVMMGAERKSLVISDVEKRSIAYHESGHALVRALTPGADPVHKVTIIPRGRALGVTHFLPVDERHIYTREWCENNLTALLGGRAAEVLILGETTTGAGDDLKRTTDLARRMVTRWGMSEKLGPITYGDEEEQIFLGREIAQHRDYSEETARAIDAEVRGIVETAFGKAKTLLSENISKLHALAQALLEREMIDAEEVRQILNGEQLAPFVARGNGTGADADGRGAPLDSDARGAPADPGAEPSSNGGGSGGDSGAKPPVEGPVPLPGEERIPIVEGRS
ncbi:MAG: ATP-dependent metallopeptidase FtsH/Yme1/Tma family protein [Gemmatimonadetes bacterium]|nr:ATP-dependent metallopeptidase FtsH/Yme1/Tma family protein [Gemmatimonadota bacterium]